MSHYVPTDEDRLREYIRSIKQDLTEPGKLTMAEYMRLQRLLAHKEKRLEWLQKNVWKAGDVGE